jgi:predicted nucleic acid-binding protein
MSQPLTVDASVFVNAFSPTEESSNHSWAYLNSLKRAGTPIIVPMLLLPEIAAAISRKQGNAALGIQLAHEVRDIPHLTLIALDKTLANQAVEIAATRRLRGSDAVYAAVVLRFGTELVTLDREQLERLAGVLTVRELL